MAHEQVGIGGGHTFDLEEMLGVEGVIVVGKDKFYELAEEPGGWLGVEKALVQEMFQERETIGMGDVGVKGGDINSGHDGVRWVGIRSYQGSG